MLYSSIFTCGVVRHKPTIKQGLIDLYQIFREMAGDDFYELRESDSESIDGNDTIGRMKGVEVQGTF